MSLIKTTNRIIEVSEINEDYMMDQKLNVQSVVLLPGIYLKFASYVDIVENSEYDADPVKVRLISSINPWLPEPRVWLFNQRLQLGFVYENCVFNVGAKVIFNLRPEVRREEAIFGLSTKMKLKAEDPQF